MVSIHAPGRGATTGLRLADYSVSGFNSRTREGCDIAVIIFILKICVSIHAPGRGATKDGQGFRPTAGGFNSRTREGCDDHNRYNEVGGLRFNSRTREGCDQAPRLCS